MLAVEDLGAWVPRSRGPQHVVLEGFAALVWEVLAESQNDVDRPETIGQERLGVVPQQLRVQCDVMVDGACTGAGGLHYLTMGAVLEIGALEDDEDLAAVDAAPIESLS